MGRLRSNSLTLRTSSIPCRCDLPSFVLDGDFDPLFSEVVERELTEPDAPPAPAVLILFSGET